MSNDTKYNGWTNYETWNLKLWMDNDEGSYRYWQEVAQECYDDAQADKTFTREENAAFALTDRLKEETEESMPEVDGFFGDVMRAAVSEVNWHEIAENLLTDVDKPEDEESDDE